jgi:transcriptional regulator with XRE-family HTH domain
MLERGLKTRIANRCMITRGHLQNIIHGRRVPSVEDAQALVEACAFLGIKTDLVDWMWPADSPVILAMRETSTKWPPGQDPGLAWSDVPKYEEPKE